VPPPAGIKPPTLWGTRARLGELFAGHDIDVTQQTFKFRYESPEQWLHVFRTYYGPTHKAFAALGAEKSGALEAEILDLLGRSNVGGSGTLIIPSDYLEAVITKR